MIVSPKKMLWPTDFSPLSIKAAECVRGLREAFNADLHVVHVIEPLVTTSMIEVPFVGGVATVVSQSELVDAATAQLRRLCGDVFHGVNVTCSTLVGVPWNEICEYAGREGIELIVVATHGRTGLKHVVLGSIAERIVQHAACPVLVVKNAPA